MTRARPFGELQITDYRLQITDYRLQITDYRLQIADCRLQIADAPTRPHRPRARCRYRMKIEEPRRLLFEFRISNFEFFPHPRGGPQITQMSTDGDLLAGNRLACRYLAPAPVFAMGLEMARPIDAPPRFGWAGGFFVLGSAVSVRGRQRVDTLHTGRVGVNSPPRTRPNSARQNRERVQTPRSPDIGSGAGGRPRSPSPFPRHCRRRPSGARGIHNRSAA